MPGLPDHPTLELAEGDAAVSLTFDDLARYAGRSSIGGVALGFKALERGLPLLAGGERPQRRTVTVETAFDGPGTRDAFEMAVRAVTGDRYRVDAGLAPPGAPEAPQGFFVFRLGHETTTVLLTLRPGLVTDEFNELIRRGAHTPAEEELIVRAKEDLAERVLALPADEVYDAEVAIRPG